MPRKIDRAAGRSGTPGRPSTHTDDGGGEYLGTHAAAEYLDMSPVTFWRYRTKFPSHLKGYEIKAREQLFYRVSDLDRFKEDFLSPRPVPVDPTAPKEK
jgi:hypothetical protein